jgi:hypothetical protein
MPLALVTLKEAGEWSLMSRNTGSTAFADDDVDMKAGVALVSG